jgi:hypothetical protein
VFYLVAGGAFTNVVEVVALVYAVSELEFGSCMTAVLVSRAILAGIAWFRT